MKKLISPLVLLATISFVGALVAKLVPAFGDWASLLSPSGGVTPTSFLKLTNSSALLAIALSVLEWLKAKKE